MSLLNKEYDDPPKYEELKLENKRQVEVDLDEVESVIQLALRTPGLSQYIDEFKDLKRYFQDLQNYCHKNNYLDFLPELLKLWGIYRKVVIQRYTNITPLELQAADLIVQNIFSRFTDDIRQKILYDLKAYPLVYGGEGGLGGYYTLPPNYGVPFAIINLPHAAFDNVWQWLALPHEIGHDLYASVNKLKEEMEVVLADVMKNRVDSGEITINDIDFMNIHVTGKEFISYLWNAWANEAQADIIGLINCGGASIASLQQIIGFSNLDSWEIQIDSNGQYIHKPEEHPTSYIRNVFNIEALKIIESNFSNNLKMGPDIKTRFDKLKPIITEIIWYYGNTNTIFTKVDIAQIEKTAKIAASTILTHKFKALDNKSYLELSPFAKKDQKIINEIVPCLLNKNPKFPEGYEPRHALAATVLAFEQPGRVIKIINETFKHFL